MATLSRLAQLGLCLALIWVSGCNKYEPAISPTTDHHVPSRMAKTFTYVDTTLDDAMVIIEENINHDNGDASYNFGEVVIDTGSFAFTVSGIYMNDDYALTDDEQKDIRDSLNNWIADYHTRVDTGSNGHAIILADVFGWEPDWGNDELSLKLHLVVGQDAPALGCDGWNEFSNDWSIITDNGWCDQNDPDNPGESDAFQEITRKLNTYISNDICFPTCEESSKLYYWNIETRTKDPWAPNNLDNPNDATHDGWLDFLLWTDRYNPQAPTLCISSAELEFYCQSSYDVAVNYNPFSGRQAIAFRASPVSISASYSYQLLSITYAEVSCE